MKYTKGTAPFAIKDGKKTVIQTFCQSPKQGLRGNSYSDALMVTANQSDKMVLTSDAKCLLPYPSRGAILDRSHNINLGEVTEITVHPEIWDTLVEQGVLDKNGNLLQVKGAEAKVEEDVPTMPAPEPEAAAEPEEAPRAEANPASNPLDVDGDGDVDAADVAAVAEAAADADAIDAMTLPQLKKKYEKVFGKAPGSNWKKETIANKIKKSL